MSVADRIDHDVPAGITFPAPPPPLRSADPDPRRSVAEEARTLIARQTVGSLASLSDDGHPWASMVTYGLLADGSPALMLSTLAEHGRNLRRDPRASLVVSEPDPGDEPLAHGRVTLLGGAVLATGELEEEARDAHLAAIPSATAYAAFRDFSLWVLRVERVRWVGGYGRMDSADAHAYAAAEPDPTAAAAPAAVAHMNADHPDALLTIARNLCGHADAAAARCTGIDRYGIDLVAETPRGAAPTRAGFAQPIADAHGLRSAAVELTRRARAKEVTQ